MDGWTEARRRVKGVPLNNAAHMACSGVPVFSTILSIVFINVVIVSVPLIMV